MNDIMALILGGGRGERLYPLTKHRAKPALPLAGKYRLIDIPVSNCINSGILQIFVLTQFNSASLNRHIADTYRFSPFMRGFVDVLAAQQTPRSPGWFEGTADAVRKSLWVIEPWSVDDYLILSGDHLYRMDYRRFVRHHRETKADVTISVLPVRESRASSFGLLKTDANGWITQFSEKPKGSALEAMRSDPEVVARAGTAAGDRPFLGSMGIYVFRRKVLGDLLQKHPEHADFGHDVIPDAIQEYKVQAYPFQGYWEDIGTVESFFRANLALVKQPRPDFSFFNAEFPIYTHARFLPPSKIQDSTISETMVSDGCLIRTATMTRSVVGIRSWIEEGVTLEDTLMMGADFYETERAGAAGRRLPAVGIGAGSVIRNAIIDKNARIGKNVRITNDAGVQHADCEDQGYCIRSGIVVVIKGAVIKNNTVI